MARFEKKEENIEAEILCYFMEKWCKCAEKNILAWYYNENKGMYQKNKSAFVRTWRSDVQVLRKWQLIVIEVKRPSEMSFFDKSIDQLREQMLQAQIRWVKNLKRHNHAVEQRQYLDDVISEWWIWFFASSVREVEERLEENWFRF